MQSSPPSKTNRPVIPPNPPLRHCVKFPLATNRPSPKITAKFTFGKPLGGLREAFSLLTPNPLFSVPPPAVGERFARARSLRKVATLALTVAIALAATLFDSPKTAYADNPAPSAIAMQSAAGTDKMYAAGDAITVRVTFPKTIQRATGARLNIQIGDNTRAAAASDCANCGMTLDFSYTVAAGDYDADGATAATDALSSTALAHFHAGTPRAFSLTLPDALARPQANHRVNLGDCDQDDGLIEVSTLDHLNAIRWDGVSGNDDPWDFGRGMQYPMLKFGGMSVAAQGSLAMGTPGANGNHPVVGENAQARLVNNPIHPRVGNAKRQSAVGVAALYGRQDAVDITEDGGPTWRYTPVYGDVGSHLRLRRLGRQRAGGADEACVRMFAKAKAAGG